jgi:hypothetical protein
MTWLLGAVLVAAGALLIVLRGMSRRLDRRRPDPALDIKPPVPKFVGYDEEKASAGWRKAQAHSETGRRLPRPRTKSRAHVVALSDIQARRHGR